MAIANISGSNTFEILVGLGMVWLAKSLTHGGAPVELETNGFTTSAIVLVVFFLISLLVLGCNGWMLDWKIAVLSFVQYFLYLAIVIALVLVTNKRQGCNMLEQ